MGSPYNQSRGRLHVLRKRDRLPNLEAPEVKCIHCKESEMFPLVSYDNPQGTIAFTVHYCRYCGSLCREDFWDNPGEAWILTDGTYENKRQTP
jgi:hypothetical protein